MDKRFNTKKFNDGLLSFGTYKTGRNEAGQKSGKEFKEFGQAYFELESVSQYDIEKFGSNMNAVSIKLSTYFMPDVQEALKVNIDNVLYEIKKIDPSKDRKLMYWFLGKLGELENGIRLRENS